MEDDHASEQNHVARKEVVPKEGGNAMELDDGQSCQNLAGREI